MIFQPGKGGDIPGLVASYGGDSDSDNEEEDPSAGTDESKFIDLSKMACLLCKRQFPNKEGLQRHVQLSDLHKVSRENSARKKIYIYTGIAMTPSTYPFDA